MLPENAFLRNLPRALDISDRLRFEAAVTASDMIFTSYVELEQILTEIAFGSASEVFFDTRINVATRCWIAIDQYYNLRQLLKNWTKAPPLTKDFINSLGDISLLRNKMDHLASNLNNLGSIKGSAHPIHGFISFLAAAKADGTYDWVQFPLGGIHHPQTYGPVIDTHILPPPTGISAINFAAFNLQINLTALVTQLRPVIQSINDAVQNTVTTAIVNAAGAQGLDPEKELKNTVSGSILIRLSGSLVKDS